MRVLVIEDEIKAAQFLKKGLQENGFTVDTARSSTEAEAAVAIHRYDLFVVDVNLSGARDGMQLLRELKSQLGSIKAIMLTARDSLPDRVAGIEAGANVYLVKPFSFSELLAYARSLTQTAHASDVTTLRVADLTVDLIRHQARRGPKLLDLTAKEFALLELLTRRAGHVLSRAVIADEIWGMNFDPGTNVVDVHIRRLRTKVDEPFPKKLIWTVRGLGYVLEERQSE
jgi:two-component system copper resistance phosphate regulon response regulator CusR